MPSPPSVAEPRYLRYDPDLPVPEGFAAALPKHPMVVLSGRYSATMEQIVFWRDAVLADSRSLNGDMLPTARPAAMGAELDQALVRWRRAHSNVFPTSIHIDDGQRMTWADQWNLTAKQRGQPKIPDRGRNWWWVEGRGLVQAADLLEGP